MIHFWKELSGNHIRKHLFSISMRPSDELTWPEAGREKGWDAGGEEVERDQKMNDAGKIHQHLWCFESVSPDCRRRKALEMESSGMEGRGSRTKKD